MKLKIIIDMAGNLSPSKWRGIGRYSLSFLEGIVNYQKGHEIYALITNFNDELSKELNEILKNILPEENIIFFEAPFNDESFSFSMQDRLRVFKTLKDGFLQNLKPDVVINTSVHDDELVQSEQTVFYDRNYMTAAIFYDIIPYIFPEIYLGNNKSIIDRYMKSVEELRNTDLLLAISDYTMKDGIDKIGIKKDRVVSINSDANPIFKRISFGKESQKRIKSKFGIDEQFILFVPGGFDARKNFERLIEAFSIMPAKYLEKYKLVITGNHSIDDEKKLKNTANKFNLKDESLILTGYVNDDDLIGLYHSCKLFIFPSLYEGFGLPILEAMRCGAVVIGSNVSSMIEILKDDLAMFDPYSVKDIRDKMLQSIENKEIRTKLKKNSKIQELAFSTKKTALLTLSALELNLSKSNKKENSKNETDTTVNLIDLAKKLNSLHGISYSKNDLFKLSKIIAKNQKYYTKKHLFIDVSHLVLFNTYTGIQRAVRSYLHKFIENPPKGYDVFPVYARTDKPYRYLNKIKKDKFIEQSTDLEIEFEKGDIFFVLDLDTYLHRAKESLFSEMKKRGVKVKFMLYDLLPIQQKEAFYEKDVENFQKYIQLTTKFDGIIAISRSVSNAYKRYIDEMGIKIAKDFQIDYNHLGANENFIASTYGTPKDYIDVLQKLKSKVTFLCVSTIEPRKKQDQLLEALEILWSNNIDVNLAFVGKEGWKVDSLIKKIKNHKFLDKKFFWFNAISDEFLEKIYNASTAVVVPSLNEGFGLPIVEGARYQKPIIARNIEVFTEIAGDHAFYFDGLTAEKLADALETWLDLYKSRKEPKSEGINVKTWEESSRDLKRLLIK